MAEITMPKLSDTMTEGVLIAWKKKAGETVSTGEVIAEVETDKATMEMEAFEEGVLSDLVPEGTKVAVGEKIAVIGGAGRQPLPRQARKTAEPARSRRQTGRARTSAATAERASHGPSRHDRQRRACQGQSAGEKGRRRARACPWVV